DNVEQGILTLNENLRINPEYSQKVLEIFSRDDLTSKKFTDLFPEKYRKKINVLIQQLFHNKFMNRKMLETINPIKEFTLLSKNHTKHLAFHFSRIYRIDKTGKTENKITKVMVVIDDKTVEYELQKKLEAKTQEQSNKVEAVYQILNLEPSIFTNFLREGTEIIALVRDKLLGEKTQFQDSNKLEESYRAVHTLKGNARALNLNNIGKVCHELEDELEKLRNSSGKVSLQLYQLVESGIDQVEKELNSGSNLFHKILGMKEALDNKSYSPISSLELLLRNLIKKESEGQNKKINFTFRNFVGETISEETIQIIKNPLLQMIRNSIAHGIEEKNIREKTEKSQIAKISVSIRQINDTLIICCEDDGKGLDAEFLKSKAIEKKLISKDESSTFTNDQCYDLIFLSGFSTANRVTETSGRGVGMDIIKQEINQAGGKIDIETEKGKFTKFIIEI
ncbi:MAG: ATP-binding protein, partial [Spirochaetota bacterium]